MKKFFTLLIFLFLWAGVSQAQVSSMPFASSSGTYTALSSETVLWSTTFDDQVSTAITIPSMTVNGTAYTSMWVTANGWIALGGTTIATSYGPISQTTSYPVVISAFGQDLQQAGSGTPKISYNTNDGGDIVVQWQDIRRYGGSYTTHRLSFQIRMNPTTNTISIVYGGTIAATSGAPTLQVGIRGATNADFNNRSTATDWAATTAGTSNSATCTFSSTIKPAVGQTYTWSPVPACSGIPAPGNTLSTLSTPCPGINFTLSLQNATTGTGVTYQWQSSPDGLAPWTNLGTASTQVTSQTSATYYQCEVTCAGQTGTSTPLLLSDPSKPSTQASAIVASNLTLSGGATLSWTNGNGGRRFVIVNNTNSFTDPSGSGDVTVVGTVYAGTGEQIVYDGTGTSVSITGLAPTTTYYVRVYEYLRCTGTPNTNYYQTTTATNNPNSFTSAFNNDDCANAITLPCGGSIAGSTVGATNENMAVCGIPNVTLQNSAGVWYKINPGATPQDITVTTCNTTVTSDSRLAVYTGTCGNLTCIGGNDDNGGCTGATLTSEVLFSAAANTDYYILVYMYSSFTQYPFVISASCVPNCTPTTLNDVCDNAETVTMVPVGGAATSTNNTCSTAEGTVAYPSCGSSFASYFDTWYKFNTGTNTFGSVLITEGTAVEVGYAIYSGTCGALTQLFCNSLITSGTAYDFTGLTANTDYYVRVWTTASVNRGTFDLAIQNPPTCLPVTAPTTTLLTNVGATFGWTSAESFFDIYIVPTGDPAPVSGTTPTENNWNGVSYSWSGGTATTTYDWYVRADCDAGGGTGISTWLGPNTFTTTVNCAAPTALTTTPGTTDPTTEVNLGWTDPTGTAWIIEWGISGYVHEGLGANLIDPVTTNPYNLTGLTAATSYQFYVKKNCGGLGNSDWAGPYSFATACANFSLNVTEGFNSTSIPICWSQQYVSGTSNLLYVASSSYPTTIPQEGTHYVNWPSFTSAAPNGAETRLVSPPITTTGTASVDVEFYWMHDPGYSTYLNEGVYVEYSTDGSAWTTVGSLIPRYDAVLTGWNLKTVTLGTGAGNKPTVYVGFRFHSQFGNNCSMDNVVIKPSPPCPAPSALDATFIDAHNATLGWTENGTATTWDVEWGVNGFSQTFNPSVNFNDISNPVVLPGLAPATSYDYYVRADCGGGQSTWAGPKTFTTAVACPAPTALTATPGTDPLTEVNLGWTDATGTSWIIDYGPVGFNHVGGLVIDPVATNPYNLTGLTAGTSYDFYVMTNCGSEGTSVWSGPFTFSTTLCDIADKCSYTFRMTDEYGDSWNGNTMAVKQNGITVATLELLVGAGPEDVLVPLCDNVGFELFWNTGGSWATEVGIEILTPWNASLYYKAPGSGSQGTTLYTGTVVCTPPACAIPTAQTTTVFTTVGADLGWNSAESFFDIYIVATGAPAPVAGTTPTVNDWNTGTSYTWSGGAAATTYDWYVRADCAAGGGSGQSDWSAAQTFTTLCNPFTLPYTENFDGVTPPAIPACMSLTNDNADTRLWQTYGSYFNSSPNCMLIAYNATAAMNDWFFSPGLSLAAGTYRVSFWYKNDGGTLYTEKMEVKWGSAPNAAGMTNGPIFDDANIATAVYLNGTGDMVVTIPGTYYVGWHGYSDADMDILTVDDISITEVLSLDAKTVSIDNIGGVVSSGTTITPQATVMNNGLTDPAVFDVTITASDGYTSTVTGVSVGAGLTAPVTFANWTPADGLWTVDVCTELTGDQNITNDCQSTGIKIFTVPTTQVYAYVAYAGASTDPEGPTSFDLSTPGTLNSIADQSTLNFIAGGSWANGIWYGVVSTDNTLISIDPVTGARTTIGALGFGMNGLSYNKANSTMYANDAASLYTVDLTTGAATLVGSNTGISMLNLAINSAGLAYTVDAIADNLGTVDLATGVYTVVGPIGFNANYAQDMEFDRVTGDLYMAAQDMTSGWLAWMDMTSGKAYKIGDFEGGAEITGFAIPYPEYKTLAGKVFLEGLYNTGTSAMNQAQDVGPTPKFTAPVADQIEVLLYSTADLVTPAYTYLYGVNPVDLNQDGTFSITDLPAAMSGQHYIVIKHRNSIETWSNEGVGFDGAGPITYDFTVALGMAYATPDPDDAPPMKLMGSIYAIWAGDYNQDGIVDGSDMAAIDNASKPPPLQGYYPEDINGDGIVDGTDMVILDNNSKPPSVQLQRP